MKNVSVGINLYQILPEETSGKALGEKVPFKISHRRDIDD